MHSSRSNNPMKRAHSIIAHPRQCRLSAGRQLQAAQRVRQRFWSSSWNASSVHAHPGAWGARACARPGAQRLSTIPDAPPVKLALWGCGGVAEAHLNAAAKFKLPVSITAVVDHDPARMSTVATLASTLEGNAGSTPPSYDSIETALATAEVDAVAILLPHNIHEESAVQMLRSGKHVLLEKPLAPTAAACDRILAAAAVSAGQFHVLENSSFWPEVVLAKQLMESGAIGELVSVRSHYYEALNASPFADEAEWLGWRRKLDINGGGIVMDGGQHWLRPLREFMGEVAEVMAVTARPFEVIEGESLCHALLRFESGKVASFQATVLSKQARMAHRADPFFRLIGQQGDLVISGTGLHGEPSVMLFTNEIPDGKEMLPPAPAPRGYMDSFGPQLGALCNSLRSGQPPPRDAAFAAGDVRVAEAIYRSAASRQWERIT